MMAAPEKTHDGFLVNPEEHPRLTVRKGHGIATPPTTPHRSKKRVRFSESSPTTETGLTPFLGRSSISSPPPSKSRRRSTPSTRWNLSVDDSPIICGTLQFVPLRQALDGRTKRRLCRRGLSEEINTIEKEEKTRKKTLIAEIDHLKKLICQKDQEIQEIRDELNLANQISSEAGVLSLNAPHVNETVRSLELEVANLKSELRKREVAMPMHDGTNWIVGARDVVIDNDDFMPGFDEDFNAETTGIFCSTPGRRSFPSPPATMPNTPCKLTSLIDANTDALAADNEGRHFESQLKVLQDELKTLRTAFELSNTTQERLVAKLAPFLSASTCPEGIESLDAAIDAVLTQLALSESTAIDSSARFSALSNELANLLPSSQPSDPESILQQLHTQFRTARLELEYLAPGENTVGFENSKLLDMLVSRIRVLTKKVQQQDADIDQYHSQEVSLRQQLGSRVDAMALLQDSLQTTKSKVSRLESDLRDRDESISKLTHALQSYRDEVGGLETFINRLEVEHAAETALLREEIETTKQGADAKILDSELELDTLKAAAEGRDMLMLELEKRLSAALATSRAVDEDFTALQNENTTLRQTITDREKAHGEALALRDARVSELREEVQRVNAALKDAHDRIMALECNNRDLEARLDGEKARCTAIVKSMMGNAAEAHTTGIGYLNNYVAVEGENSGGGESDSSPVIAAVAPHVVVKPGPGLLFNAGLARRRSTSVGKGKIRRRYDSGFGVLEEADEVLENSEP